MRSSFVGIDLAWSRRHPSGLAALAPADGGLAIADLACGGDDRAIVDFVTTHRADRTIVLVDAPLVVPNPTGMRACDRETHRIFGSRQAGAYPANRRTLGRYTSDGRPRGEAIAEALAALGFHGPEVDLPLPPLGPGGWVFECYPHPAIVTLFGLERSLKYKLKRQGYVRARAEFRRYLDGMRALRGPAISWRPGDLEALDVSRAVGRGYKDREDRLDALLCAYLGALLAEGRLEPLGSPRLGMIVVPRATA